MVICSNCQKREAKRQAAVNIDGKLVYMPLCDECFNDLQKKSKRTESLDQFGRDLTQMAKLGRLDPVIGRDKEINRVIHILSRRTKNNPVLIGEPGVGKTAIVEGLALKINENTVPEPLRNKRLVSLDLASIISGTVHRGAFEKRLKEIIEEVVKAEGQIILFIDEIHTIVGAGATQGSLDASNILKPYLARGDLQLVGATTIKEFRIIEKDAALERRFQQILVEEPTIEQTKEILLGLRPRYEDHHKIEITNEAIDAAVKLSSRYISNKFLPDKAIDLIDEAGAYLRLKLSSEEPDNLREVNNNIREIEKLMAKSKSKEDKEKLTKKLEKLKEVHAELTALWVQTKLENVPVLTEEHIAKIISDSTGIPLSELTVDERKKLKSLESDLKKRIVGQDEAIEIVSHAIKRARAGVKQLDRPIGTFMFLGPTGVGKTELAKALAEVMYGSEDYLIRVDMSEFTEKHNVARLIGSPPGYVGYDEGGQLTDKVRRKPFCIVLFDEIEKAHQDVYNMLLQVLDDGILTDGHGRTVNFKNTIIIMTSNVGSEFLKRQTIGFSEVESSGDVESVEEAHSNIKDRLKESLESSFKPEFINRIDDVIVFKPLSKKEIEEVVDIQINKLQDRLFESGIKIVVTKKARQLLADRGYNLEMGVRPLKRLVQKEVENQLSELIIDQAVKSGDKVNVEVVKEKIVLVVA